MAVFKSKLTVKAPSGRALVELVTGSIVKGTVRFDEPFEGLVEHFKYTPDDKYVGLGKVKKEVSVYFDIKDDGTNPLTVKVTGVSLESGTISIGSGVLDRPIPLDGETEIVDLIP